MDKFVVIYYRVDDEDALETFYAGTHRHLLEQLPGLLKLEVSRVTGQPEGNSRFHLMVEAYFESEKTRETALLSEPGLAMMNALKPWADNRLIVWYYANSFSEEKQPPPTGSGAAAHSA